MEQPIDQSVITLEGLGCDKRKRHKKLCEESLMCIGSMSGRF